ncbi:dihydrofolate reductase [Pueribacillus theae]|uniref:Dihydrofolate reductase n=1 Tax=Pueribacillus theae TaxID=2171751 RepID=A0A2U1K857_9BACI|nr:dihydrofolate reductase [Pueribacillus theae]PWA13263.1 dihydrofolate reductase [Pueribacillus theae]
MISFLVAMDKNRLIGKDNDLPWRLPADLAFFKKKTTGNTIIMGRKTYASIGRPLPNRRNVILTRDKNFNAEGCIIVHTVEDAIASIQPNEEGFVIGGAEIFPQFLPYADKMYITFINEEFDGDTYFPEIDMEKWQLVSREKGIKNDKNPYDYEFLCYKKLPI